MRDGRWGRGAEFVGGKEDGLQVVVEEEIEGGGVGQVGWGEEFGRWGGG